MHSDRINRRRLLTGAAGVGLALASSPLRQGTAAEAGSHFLVIGDWGAPEESDQRAVARHMGEVARSVGSKFVVAVGDNFYESGVKSVADPQWRRTFEDVYTAKSLQTPWYAALGNHDYRGSPQAQIDYSLASARWRMPRRYYKVPVEASGTIQADIFILDTTALVTQYRASKYPRVIHNLRDEDAAAQLEWLDAELGRSRAPWKLVFGHHPIFSGGEHGGTPDLMSSLKPLMQRHGVQAYVSGHDHDLQHIEVDGIAYICTGAGSGSRPVTKTTGTIFCAAEPGFTAFEVSMNALRVDFHGVRGDALHRAFVLRAPAEVQS